MRIKGTREGIIEIIAQILTEKELHLGLEVLLQKILHMPALNLILKKLFEYIQSTEGSLEGGGGPNVRLNISQT